MRVPIAEPRTRPSAEKLDMFQATPLETRGLRRGAYQLAGAVEAYGQRQDAANEKLYRFDALRKLSDFQTQTALELDEMKKAYDPLDDQFPRKVQEHVAKREAALLSQIRPELQDEFAYRSNEFRNGVVLDTEGFIQKSRLEFFKNGINAEAENLKTQFAQDPNDDNFVVAVDQWETLVDSADVPEQVKSEWIMQGRKELESISFKNKVTQGYTALINAKGAPGPAQDAITSAATELGIDPIDLATVISYETGGRFSTSIKGGKGGNYLGLIQFGPEEQKKYGVQPGEPFQVQLQKVVKFLQDRGFKPGMGIEDLYSTINAGSPGRLAASDGRNTVAGHVAEMQGAHRQKAIALMKGQIDPQGLMTDPMYANLSYEEKTRLTQDAVKEGNEIFAAQQKAAKDQENAYNNQLFIGLYEGTKGKAEIDEAVSLGFLSNYEDLKKANDIYEKKHAEAISARDFSAMLAGQRFFDSSNTDHKKMFNDWVGDEGLKRLNNMDQEYINNVLGPTIRQVHSIPTSVVGGLEAMARSRDPKRQGFALNTLAQFEDWEPAAFKGVDPKTQSDVNLWRRWKDVLPQDELFREINGGLDAAQRQAKARFREEAEKVLTDAKHPNYLSHDALLEEFDGWFTAAPAMPNIWWARDGMMNDYQSIFLNEYVRHNGDVPAAQESTLKQLQSMWSVTSVGGSSTLMRNAPTQPHVYPTYLGSYDYMDAQTRADNGLRPDEKFQLISDDQTQREIDQKIPPSYLVVKQDASGVWREVTRPDGRLSRQFFAFTPDMTVTENIDMKVKELEYNLTHFNLGEENVLDATDDRRAVLREQRKTMQLRLQELKAELAQRVPKAGSVAGNEPGEVAPYAAP